MGSSGFGSISSNKAAMKDLICDTVNNADGTTPNCSGSGGGGGGSARSVAGDTDNGVITWVTSNNTFAAESGLTYDGSSLVVDGSISGSSTIRSHGDITTAGGLIVTGAIHTSGITAGTDNTVLVLNSSNKIVSDEIDSRVWGSTLVDATGTPVNNQLAVFTDANTIEGESEVTYDGSTLAVLGAVSASGVSQFAHINSNGINSFGSDSWSQSIMGAQLQIGVPGHSKQRPQGTAFTASYGINFATGSSLSGTVAGIGSYLGLDKDNNVILTPVPGTGSSGAPDDAQYVTLAADGDLSAERVLTAGDNITLTDGGAGGNITVSSTQYMTFNTPAIYAAPAAVNRVYFTGDAPDDNFDTYNNYITSKNIPEPGNFADFGQDREYYTFSHTFQFIVPRDCTIMSASYVYLNRSANASCTRVRWAIMKLRGDQLYDDGGAAQATTIEPMTMYYEDIVPDAGNVVDKVYGRKFALTGAASHLTCSAGDCILYALETFGASAGAGYLYNTLECKIDD